MPGSVAEAAESDSRSRTALITDLPWAAALFLASLWAIVQTMGSSPSVWVDTIIEDQVVRECVLGNRCTTVGVGATVGIFHSAGYLYWRSLLTWMGLTPNGAFLTLLVMNALGVVLVALAARRLDGPISGALAAIVMRSMGVPMQLDVISDVAPVPFLGAVFLLLAVETAARPTFGMLALLGIVAGVASNTYASCLLCGVSAVWIALLVPDRRWTRAAVAAGAFAVATFAIAPVTWIVDARLLLTHSVAGNGTRINPRRLLDIPIARLAFLSCLTCVGGMIASQRLRRQLMVPAAILVPLVIPMVAGSAVGRLDPQDKYCAHVLGAIAIGLIVPAISLIRLGLRPKTPGAGGPAAARLRRLAPYAAAAFIGFDFPVGAVSGLIPSDITAPNFHDLSWAERTLVSQGWSWPKAVRDLKVEDDTVRRALLMVPGWPDTAAGAALERAYLLKVPSGIVPYDLPANVLATSSTGSNEMVLALTCSWIDWKSFRVCVSGPGHPDEHCTQTGLPAARAAYLNDTIPGMPLADMGDPSRRTITLHFLLKPGPQCPEEMIYMPRMPRVCPGRITSIDGGTSGIEESGRVATLRQKGSAGGPPREASIEFQLGDPTCWNEYRGYPPFFVEGDPASVTLLKGVLERL